METDQSFHYQQMVGTDGPRARSEQRGKVGPIHTVCKKLPPTIVRSLVSWWRMEQDVLWSRKERLR